jgi:branched-chain amino acid transport system substrate-binding protein
MVFASGHAEGGFDRAGQIPAGAGADPLPGVTGDIAFDPKGDLRNAALTLYTYRQGKQVKLQVVR